MNTSWRSRVLFRKALASRISMSSTSTTPVKLLLQRRSLRWEIRLTIGLSLSLEMFIFSFINGNPDAIKKISSQLFKDMHKELIDCMQIVGFNEEVFLDFF